MLLPSALSCDSSQPPPLTRLHPPQLSPQTALGNIFTTCRSLQSLLAAPSPPADSNLHEPITPPASSHAQLPTPPLAHAPPPLKLRLRSRKTDNTAAGGSGADHGPPRKRIVKRSVAPPARGPNKRRRHVDDDMGRDDGDADISDLEQPELLVATKASPADQNKENEPLQESSVPAPAPHTPKRSRIAPEVLPLGLERSDYHTLHADGVPHDDSTSQIAQGTDVVVEADGETWSTEEDRMLVELVLEKLKLSKSDWQDCARSLGKKDRGSVGRRWKSLMLNGDVGLKKGSSRRAKLHGTWR
ncbi:hypothetical protein MMYC01_202826 [Madurella mycetomatis]|uniref:Myb-like domain-containing protein n=1 Tax=Madurella mycetomatis TaxID=100816 RepID=A0A175W801_9PEZI|nr:hypothetical protein MMYC01_202826 [Madurella mycetomatis]